MVSTPTAMLRERRPPESFSLLGGGQHRRYDDGAGVHRPALEGVVEVLAMRGGAVDEGGPSGAERPGMADGRSRAGIRPSRECGCDIVGAPRHDAQADDIDQQPLARLAHRREQVRRIHGRNALSERLSDGLGCYCHINCSADATRR
jgi:hypothetical protein